MSVGLFSVSVEVGGTNARSRVLIALNAMIPDTATTCKSKTISNARDNFMFGAGIPSNSVPADAADARRAVAARSFFDLKSCGIFIGLFGAGLRPHRGAKLRAGPARAREIDHRGRRSF